MKINVERDHIANGIQNDSHACMIADAIKETVPDAIYILVDLQSIRFSCRAENKRYTYLTPPAAQHNLLRFDKGVKSIQPFSFKLHDPKTREMGWAQNRTARSRKGAKKRYKPTGKRRHIVAYKERTFDLRQFVEA